MSAVIEVSVRRQVVIEVVRNRGAVYSVNGQTGAVLLDYEDLGADPEGAAAAALAAANTHTDEGLATKQDRISGPLSPVGITAVGTDVTVAAADYYIADLGEFSSPESGFTVALSSSGMVRYVGYYGNADGEVVKVEGAEGASAVYPTTPEDAAPLGFQLVTDAGIEEPEEPATVNFADIGQNASDNTSLVAYVAAQIEAAVRQVPMIHSHVTQFSPADGTYYYFGQPNIDVASAANDLVTNIREIGAPVTGTIVAAIITFRETNFASVSAEPALLSMRNTTAGTLHTITNALSFASTTVNKVTVVTGLSIAVTRGNLCQTLLSNTWATNPTGVAIQVQYIIQT